MAAATHSTSKRATLDIRVEDFLDDRLQSTADFENLDELLAKVDHQRSQLQAQLDTARKEAEEARSTARDRQASLATRIAAFQKLQTSIDVRVKVAAASDAPTQAIARLSQPMRTVHSVELAYKYLHMLQDVEQLRKEARSHLPASPSAALEPYAALKQLSSRLLALQGAADDAAVHLVTYVHYVTESLWEEMRKTMSAELESVLSKRKWPMVDPESEMDEEWLRSIEKLLDLQVAEVLYTDGITSLLPFEVMSRIFVSEFRFHFMSERPTSSAQATGTHCFPWFIATVEKWEDFFRDNLSHTLAAKFRGTAAAKNMLYVDPVCALVTALLPVMREKVRRTAAEATKSPTFLSSFMGQLMTFDDNIRSKFNYDGGDPENGWAGLTTEVLEDHFETWFAAEKEFAQERYRAILKSPDSRNIDYDYSGTGKTKPTHGAVRVIDLLKSLTSQYERVRKFKHKIRFLIGIQLDILDEYHDLLRGSLERYQGLTTAMGRTLHGGTKEELAALEGTGGLETLCKVFGSADHVVSTLKDWSNEEFFVLLWDQLQSRAKRGNHQHTMSGDMSYDDIKDRTSSAVGSVEEDGVIFDETIAAYTGRRKTALDFLVGALAESHQKAFRAYLTRTHWTGTRYGTPDASGEIDFAQLTVTPELDEPLRVMKLNLDFLQKALGTAAFRRVWREALEKLQDMLWTEVLMRQGFTAYGAAQFMRDFNAVLSLLERYLPNGVRSLSSLADGLLLLNLPVNPTESGMTLMQASDRIFTDNSEAKAALEELGVESLSPANARHILQRRVENAE